MKVLLIRHPTTHFAKTAPPVSGLPLGILYVAAALKAAGYPVQLYDAIVDADEKRWGDACEDGKYQMGATQEEIGRFVAEAAPDVVGISNQYTSQVNNAIKTAQTVKEVNSAITVVVGGPHASVMPSSFFENPGIVDFAVIGEGEKTMVNLLDCLRSGKDVSRLKGIAYLKDGQLVIQKKKKFIADLDRIQLPAYDLLDMERYFYFNKKGKDGRESYQYPASHRSISMITSRGCPFNCIFCSIHLSMGRQFRAHSVSYVLNHIQHIQREYDIRHIHFEDDNFTLDMDRFSAIIDGLIAARLPITWDTPNGVRADYLNHSILKKCKTSKCTYLRIGVESANETVSKEIVRKHLELKTVVDVAKQCQKIGIDLDAFYMIGLPGENLSQMEETIDFAILHECIHGLTPYGMFTATPLIGTDLYKMCVDRGYITSELSFNNIATATQGEGMISTENFSPDTLKTLLKKYRRRHLVAKALYSLKFFCQHPRYLINRLSTRYYLRQLLPLLMRGQLIQFIKDVFLYRYKNCVIRKIGLS